MSLDYAFIRKGNRCVTFKDGARQLIEYYRTEAVKDPNIKWTSSKVLSEPSSMEEALEFLEA